MFVALYKPPVQGTPKVDVSQHRSCSTGGETEARQSGGGEARSSVHPVSPQTRALIQRSGAFAGWEGCQGLPMELRAPEMAQGLVTRVRVGPS